MAANVFPFPRLEFEWMLDKSTRTRVTRITRTPIAFTEPIESAFRRPKQTMEGWDVTPETPLRVYRTNLYTQPLDRR